MTQLADNGIPLVEGYYVQLKLLHVEVNQNSIKTKKNDKNIRKNGYTKTRFLAKDELRTPDELRDRSKRSQNLLSTQGVQKSRAKG